MARTITKRKSTGGNAPRVTLGSAPLPKAIRVGGRPRRTKAKDVAPEVDLAASIQTETDEDSCEILKKDVNPCTVSSVSFSLSPSE